MDYQVGRRYKSTVKYKSGVRYESAVRYENSVRNPSNGPPATYPGKGRRAY